MCPTACSGFMHVQPSRHKALGKSELGPPHENKFLKCPYRTTPSDLLNNMLVRGFPAMRLQPYVGRGPCSTLFHPIKHTGRDIAKLPAHAVPRVASRSFLNLNGILGGGSPQGEEFHETVILPYSSAELFKVVSDVDSYSEFVPFCVASRVLGPSKNPDPRTKKDRATSVMDAELAIGFASVRESYVSEVSMRPNDFVTVCQLSYVRPVRSHRLYSMSSVRHGNFTLCQRQTSHPEHVSGLLCTIPLQTNSTQHLRVKSSKSSPQK